MSRWHSFGVYRFFFLTYDVFDCILDTLFAPTPIYAMSCSGVIKAQSFLIKYFTLLIHSSDLSTSIDLCLVSL